MRLPSWSEPLNACRTGEAVNPRNLSWYERVSGVGKHYNKQLDREDLYDEQFEAAKTAGRGAAAV